LIAGEDLATGQEINYFRKGIGSRWRRFPITKAKKMKRISNLYVRIIDTENIALADSIARRGKLLSSGVRVHDRNREANLLQLHEQLKNKTFKTSPYHIFKMIADNNKEREIFRLPYFPDRILHHAIMNVMEPIWVSTFTNDTYACIKNRGIHLAMRRLKFVLKQDPDNTVYCLKLDIRKFYPSVYHDLVKLTLRRKIKDNDLLWLLDGIVDSAPGLPIGNYLSQYLSNIYLTPFDHWLKEVKQVKYYFRYADDMVILHRDKQYLHDLCKDIDAYLRNNLKLQLKGNYQVFPVGSRGIDYLGYVFYHTHTLLRKSIKRRMCVRLAKLRKRGASPIAIKEQAIAWHGWYKHCNCRNLVKKLTT
jgi:retron-type reverse transcriptase